MAARRGLGVVLLIVIGGLTVGSLVGELFGNLISAGWVHDVLTKGPTIGLTQPVTLDLRFLSLTFGLILKVNLVGILGIVLAAVTLRRL